VRALAFKLRGDPATSVRAWRFSLEIYAKVAFPGVQSSAPMNGASEQMAHAQILNRRGSGLGEADNRTIDMINTAAIQDLLKPLFPGLMGMQLDEVLADRVVASMLVRQDLCTTGEVLHGGAIMAFADTIGAVATFVNLPKGARTVTIESKTNFVGAAPVGTRVIGECTPFHRGQTTMVWQTLIKSESGKLCAVVIQTQMVIPE
jgi:1,4-dihydroxy-2-naphthoyl-CoA hydrolase